MREDAALALLDRVLEHYGWFFDRIQEFFTGGDPDIAREVVEEMYLRFYFVTRRGGVPDSYGTLLAAIAVRVLKNRGLSLCP